MEIQIKLFTEEEKDLVHQRTMEILEKTGVQFKSRKAFQILKDAGCRTDDARQVVFFDEAMVMDAVDKAPASFVLGGRNPKYDFPLPAKQSGQLMSGITTNIYDPYTRECRESLKSDVTNVGRVFQFAETGVACTSGCSANDMPDKTHCLHEMAAILAGTSKHIQFQLSNPYESSFAGRILETVCGSKEAVRQRKIASAIYCPVSPLVQDGEMIDALLELEEYEVPICIYPMPMIGMTSPASIFSTICQVNAEVLSALTLFQLVKPGWPMIYGAAAAKADPISGEYVRSGEAELISLGGIEMARRYGLPCEVIGGASYETMPVYLGKADIVDGIGITDQSMSVSLEMILTEDEIGKRCLRVAKGVEIREDTDLTADILEEGPGGAFLAKRSTMKNFRNADELYYSKLFPLKLRTTTFEKRDSIEIANQRVREILEAPIVDALPEDVQAAIDGICAEADAGI